MSEELDCTHITIHGGKLTGAPNPGGMGLLTPPTVSAIDWALFQSWINTHGSIDAVCAANGWTNELGVNINAS